MAENRTDSESRIVPSSFTAERVVRGFLADTLNFLRGRRRWPEVDGDLSDWVLRMHGIETGNQSEDLGDIDFQQILSSLDSLCAALQGTHDTEIRRQLQAIGKEEKPRVLEAQQSNDREALDVVLSRAIPRMLRVAGMPESYSRKVDIISFAGFVKLLRATRAMLVSMALFHEHPLSLIARAFRGDRRATLDLIKVDHMFVNDRCCFWDSASATALATTHHRRLDPNRPRCELSQRAGSSQRSWFCQVSL